MRRFFPRPLSRGHCAAVVFILATLRAMLFLPGYGYFDVAPYAEEAGIAAHLVRHGAFLTPLDPSASAPPTAWCAPGYPALIAAVYGVFGLKTHASLTALAVVHALCFGVAAAALYRLAASAFGTVAGLVAAAMLCVHPLALACVTDFWDSFPGLALFLVAAALVEHLSRTTRRRGAKLVALGLVLGLLSLTSTTYALTYPLLLLVSTRASAGRRRFVEFVAAVAVLLVVVTPWTVRNYRTFGSLFFVRRGFAFELWWGNQPQSTGWQDEALLRSHVSVNPDEARFALNVGEGEYFRLCGERFAADYRRDPAAFWRRTARRALYLPFSNPAAPSLNRFMPDWQWRGVYWDKILLNGAVAAMAVIGAWLSRGKLMWLLAAAALAVAPYLFVALSDRFALPLRILLLPHAAFATCWLAKRAGSGGGEEDAARERAVTGGSRF